MKENKQVNPAVSSCTAEIVQKDGLAKISRSPGIEMCIRDSRYTGTRPA